MEVAGKEDREKQWGKRIREKQWERGQGTAMGKRIGNSNGKEDREQQWERG